MGKYTINNIEVPGVTSVLGTLDKSGAMKGWATGCMEKYIREELTDSWDEDSGLEYVLNVVKMARFDYKKVSKEAMSIGTKVHGIVERHIKQKIQGDTLPSILETDNMAEVQNGWNAFLEWEKKHVVKYLETEHTVFHPSELYGGTLDCIAELKDGVYIIDFKTSKAFYDDEMSMQLSAYRYAKCSCWNETLHIKNRDGKEFTQKPTGSLGITQMGVLRLDKETGIPEFKNYSEKYDRKLASFLSLLDHWYKDKNRQLKGNDRALKLKEKFKK